MCGSSTPTPLLFCFGDAGPLRQASPCACTRAAGAGAAVVARHFSSAAAHRGARVRPLPCRPHGHLARVSAGGWEAFFGDSYVSKFSRSGVTAISELMTTDTWNPTATVADRLEDAAGGNLHARQRSRRTSSWCTTNRASTSALRLASRCRRATAAISAPSTARSGTSSPKAPAGRAGTPSTTCWRAVGALVRALRLLRDAHRRRTGRARAADARCADAAIALSRSIRRSALS